MLIEHRGNQPYVDPSATIAPTAVIAGDAPLYPNFRTVSLVLEWPQLTPFVTHYPSCKTSSP
jgi:hypothetical protein